MKRILFFVLFFVFSFAQVNFSFSAEPSEIGYKEARLNVGIVGGGVTAGGGSYQTPTFGDVNEMTDTDTASPTLNIPGTLNVATGDLLIVLAGGTETVSSVACGSNSLARIKQITSDGYTVELWYKENATAGATTSCVVTYSTTSNYAFGVFANYSGIATSSSLDQSSCNAAGCNAIAATSLTWTAQNVATTQTDELLLFAAVGMETHSSFTAAGGWTKRTAVNMTWVLIDKNVTSTGTHPSGTVVTVADNTDNRYWSTFATFKAKAN